MSSAIKRELDKLREELSKKKHLIAGDGLSDLELARRIAFILAEGVEEDATDDALEAAWAVSAKMNPEEPLELLAWAKDQALAREVSRQARRPYLSVAEIVSSRQPAPPPPFPEDEPRYFIGDDFERR
jgi:hypothetical protein